MGRPPPSVGYISDAEAERLPQRPEVFWPWWSYLEEAAPAERRAWARVLQELRTGPTRVELISRFPEWPIRPRRRTAWASCLAPGSGAVLPRLLDGRYLLTTLGVALVEQAEARVPARPGGE